MWALLHVPSPQCGQPGLCLVTDSSNVPLSSSEVAHAVLVKSCTCHHTLTKETAGADRMQNGGMAVTL